MIHAINMKMKRLQFGKHKVQAKCYLLRRKIHFPAARRTTRSTKLPPNCSFSYGHKIINKITIKKHYHFHFNRNGVGNTTIKRTRKQKKLRDGINIDCRMGFGYMRKFKKEKHFDGSQNWTLNKITEIKRNETKL